MKIKKDISSIISDLKEKRVWKNEDIEEYLEKEGSPENKDFMFELVEKLKDEDNIFRWLDFICDKLLLIAEDSDRFVNLLEGITEKVGEDMAGGKFVSTLVQIGKDDEQLGWKLIERIQKHNSGEYDITAGHILGGIGRNDFEGVYELISTEYLTKDNRSKTALLRAFSIMSEGQEKLPDDKIFQYVDSAANSKDISLKIEAVHTYYTLHKFDAEYVEGNLIRLSEREDSIVRHHILNLLYNPTLSPDSRFTILSKCAEDDDHNLLNKVAFILEKECKGHVPECMKIAKDWIKERKHHFQNFDYLLEKIGSADPGKCISIVEEWIRTEDDGILWYCFPKILVLIGRNDVHRLLDFLSRLAEETPEDEDITTRTIIKLLSGHTKESSLDEDVVKRCYGILTKLAQKYGLNAEKITRGETRLDFKCLRLARAVQSFKSDIDYRDMERRLHKYPTLLTFLGSRWLSDLEAEGNKTHPLLIVLSRDEPDQDIIKSEREALKNSSSIDEKMGHSWRLQSMLRPKAFLEHLEHKLISFKSNEHRIRGIKEKLRSEDHFYNAVSEIEVIGSVREVLDRDRVQLEPEIERTSGNSSYLDAVIEANSGEVLIEITNPEMYKPLLLKDGGMGIPNRAVDVLLSKYEKQLKDATNIADRPIVIVIDMDRSEIDEHQIRAAVHGSPQITLFHDKETREYVGSSPSLAEDSITDKKEEASIISAVIGYKSFLGDDGKTHLWGIIEPTKNPINSLNGETLNLLKSALGLEFKG